MKKIGKYELLRELGRGTTSAVYLASDPFAGRKVAIKVVKAEALGDEEFGRRFRRLFLTEASLAGKLEHPHIAAIYDAEATAEGSYIVMEYVEGGTLEPFCRTGNLLPVQRIIEIVFKCARALDFAHRHGVIHRDIKPANILVGEGSDIKISDFGAALSLSSETTQVTGVGSPAYMSPEQVLDETLNHQTDIFSLGVVMYQLLTGQLPFKASTTGSMVYQIVHVDPPPPSALRAGIPATVDQIVMKALHKKLDQRYRTWAEFSTDLASAFAAWQSLTEAVPEAERFSILREMPFFRDFGEADLWQVVRISEWSRHRAGRPVIREGEAGASFFILARGEVKVTRSGRLLNVLKAGECFGEMSYLGASDYHRTATVTALNDVTLIEVADEALARSPETCRNRFNAAFLKLLVDRLQSANIRVSQLLIDRGAPAR